MAKPSLSSQRSFKQSLATLRRRAPLSLHSATKQSMTAKVHADYRQKKVALIVTVYNEEASILALLKSYAQQSIQADEVILVDAASTDQTLALAQSFADQHPHLHIKVFSHAGNRSQGRNYAVAQTAAEWLAVTDAGCVLDTHWLEELLRRQQQTQALVVAGFYRGVADTPLQEAFLPYFLIMPDQVKNQDFLPATRSMLISRELWWQMGGLNESLEVSEDYQLAKKIKDAAYPMAFAPQAIVFWHAPETWQEFGTKIAQFAAGDVKAGVIRPKVYLIFARYSLFAFLVVLALWNAALGNTIVAFLLGMVILVIFFLYIYWSMSKNLRYCPHSWYYLPLLQIISDLLIIRANLLTVSGVA